MEESLLAVEHIKNNRDEGNRRFNKSWGGKYIKEISEREQPYWLILHKNNRGEGPVKL